MRFVVKHEIRGRIRIQVLQRRMSYEEADILQYSLDNREQVTRVQVKERVQDIVIFYMGDREAIIDMLRRFHYEAVSVPSTYLENSGRALNDQYYEKLVNRIVLHYGTRLLVPKPIRMVITWTKALKYLWLGVKCLFSGKIQVPVL